jgi:hypothetical protein
MNRRALRENENTRSLQKAKHLFFWPPVEWRGRGGKEEPRGLNPLLSFCPLVPQSSSFPKDLQSSLKYTGTQHTMCLHCRYLKTRVRTLRNSVVSLANRGKAPNIDLEHRPSNLTQGMKTQSTYTFHNGFSQHKHAELPTFSSKPGSIPYRFASSVGPSVLPRLVASHCLRKISFRCSTFRRPAPTLTSSSYTFPLRASVCRSVGIDFVGSWREACGETNGLLKKYKVS